MCGTLNKSTNHSTAFAVTEDVKTRPGANRESPRGSFFEHKGGTLCVFSGKLAPEKCNF